MARVKICVGLTGPNASGKGEVARFLEGKGFSLCSLSDVVRQEATRRGLDHSRENLIRTGTALREQFGEGVLAQRTLPKISQRSVVDSIRNPGEIQVLRTLPGFHLGGTMQHLVGRNVVQYEADGLGRRYHANLG